MVINWTNSAMKDLQCFRENTKVINVTDYIFALIENVNLLLEYPQAGKAYFYAHNLLIRQLIYKKHRILYYVDEDIIHIISIIHHRQNIKNKIDFIKKFFK